MRSLRSFLLEETNIIQEEEESKKEKKKDPDAPAGFKLLPRQGDITDELKDILKIQKAKELDLRFEGKVSKNLKVASEKGREEIIKELGISGKDPIAVIVQVMQAEKMSSIFIGKPEKKKGEIAFQLNKKYGSLAGTRPSSLKFIKFWIECACISVGIKEAPTTLKFYVEHDGKNYGNQVIVKT